MQLIHHTWALECGTQTFARTIQTLFASNLQATARAGERTFPSARNRPAWIGKHADVRARSRPKPSKYVLFYLRRHVPTCWFVGLTARRIARDLILTLEIQIPWDMSSGQSVSSRVCTCREVSKQEIVVTLASFVSEEISAKETTTPGITLEERM